MERSRYVQYLLVFRSTSLTIRESCNEKIIYTGSAYTKAEKNGERNVKVCDEIVIKSGSETKAQDKFANKKIEALFEPDRIKLFYLFNMLEQ